MSDIRSGWYFYPDKTLVLTSVAWQFGTATKANHFIPSHGRLLSTSFFFLSQNSVTLHTHNMSDFSQRCSFSACLRFPLKYFAHFRSILTSFLGRFFVPLSSNSTHSLGSFYFCLSLNPVHLRLMLLGQFTFNCGLFNDADSSSVCIASSNSMINNKLERNDRGLL